MCVDCYACENAVFVVGMRQINFLSQVLKEFKHPESSNQIKAHSKTRGVTAGVNLNDFHTFGNCWYSIHKLIMLVKSRVSL